MAQIAKKPTSRLGSGLGLDRSDVRRARTLARQVGKPIVDLATRHTTVSVERATLRLAGLGGADPDGTPWVNRLADAVRADVGLEHGVSLPVWDALLRGEGDDLLTLAQKAAAGSVTFRVPEGKDATAAARQSRRSSATRSRRGSPAMASSRSRSRPASCASSRSRRTSVSPASKRRRSRSRGSTSSSSTGAGSSHRPTSTPTSGRR